jgi:hypothetical protein
LWSTVASKAKPRPPEGLGHGELFNWYAERGMRLPDRNRVLNPNKAIQRKFGGPKFPWPAYPFDHNALFTKDRYIIDTNRPASDSQGRPRRRDPSMGPQYIPVLDWDENIRPCYYVYMTKGACPYPDNNECLANHNVEHDQWDWLIKVRGWSPLAVNHLIENSRSNTPRDMKPENRLKLFPPRNKITGPIPKGTTTEADIEEWRGTNGIVDENNEPTSQGSVDEAECAFAEGVQMDDATRRVPRATEEEGSDASISEERITAALNATRERVPRTSYPTYLTSALNTSRYVLSTPSKPSKLALRRARQLGRDPPE